MPKKAKIAPAVRREWLVDYERGKRIDAIAREAGRTERTVKDQVERARQELERQQVRAGLLRDAYQKHFEDLMGLAEQLRQAAETPSSHGLQIVRGQRRTELLQQALQSHIPRSQLWKTCSKWKDSAARLIETEKRIKVRVAELVQREVLSHFPEVIRDGFAESLWTGLQYTALGSDVSSLQYSPGQDEQGLYLGWGAHPLARKVPDKARLTAIQDKHGAIVEDVVAWEFVAKFRKALHDWEQNRDAIQQEVEILLLRRLLPGFCNLCPGSEGPSFRRRRHVRREP